MTIYLGADHRGFQLKEELLEELVQAGLQVVDCGNTILDLADDYPEFAFKVAEEVAADSQSMGIILCGSGVGATIAANKVKGVRCGLGFTTEQVKAGRNDDDMNVLTIASDYTPMELAKGLVDTFIHTDFGNALRYQNRLDMIKKKEMS